MTIALDPLVALLEERSSRVAAGLEAASMSKVLRGRAALLCFGSGFWDCLQPPHASRNQLRAPPPLYARSDEPGEQDPDKASDPTREDWVAAHALRR